MDLVSLGEGTGHGNVPPVSGFGLGYARTRFSVRSIFVELPHRPRGILIALLTLLHDCYALPGEMLMKIVRILAIILGAYVVLGLSLDAAIGYFQPQRQGTIVLRTFDSSGASGDTVLGLREDNGQLWVESGHWFRGWYKRILANPNVELVRDGRAVPYRAVPDDSPETVERITQLMGKGAGANYWVMRTLLLWAPVKPVRLDPRSAR
jgi:hypothetical protein